MQAINYTRLNFNAGKISDDLETLQAKFSCQKIFFLPIINEDNEVICILKENELDVDLKNKLIQQEPPIYCFDHQHIIEVIEILISNSLDCIPVIDQNKKYKGSITLLEIKRYFSELMGFKFPGAVIILEVQAQDYSLVEISEIIESNGAKILTFNISQKNNGSTMLLTFKINTKETTSILQAFRRYNYNIHSHFLGQDTMEKFYQNRIDEFMKYINM